MRIAIFSDSYHPVINGVTTSIRLLVQALREAGHEALLLAPEVPGYREQEPWVRRLASVRFPLHPQDRVSLPWPVAHLREALAFDPEVVHLHTPFHMGLFGWLVAARLGRPRVFTHHTLFEEYLHYVPGPRWLLAPAAVGLCRWFWNTSRVVVAPSAEVRDRMVRQGLRRPLEVIPTGVDLASFQGGDPSRVREELGLEPGDPVLLYMGRVAREKSLDFLLEVLGQARRCDPRLRLVLVGDGPGRADLEARAQALGLGGQATFLGYRPRSELKHYLAASTLFVFASQTETQGLVLLEAQAAGVPVLAVRASGVNEAVAPGRSGFLVEPGDLEGFVGTLRRVVDDPGLRRQLAAGACEQADRFSISAMGRRIVEVYQRACGPGSAPAPSSPRALR